MKRTIKIALAVLLLALCAGMLAGCAGDKAQSEVQAPFPSAVVLFEGGERG